MRSFPTKPERKARIEIIPMIDVMMFLLVFFVLISLNVLPALGLKISPPSSARPDRVVERTKVIVGIDKDGGTFLDGHAISLAELPDRLRPLPGEQPPVVVIAGDGASQLQSMVSVLDALKSAGIANAQIVAKQK
jgi:biopolymer transport protein ExbD